MVEDRLTDGTRIGQLLSSEIHGRESGPFGRLRVVEAVEDVEPTEFGAFAFGIDLVGDDVDEEGDGTIEADDSRRLADVHVHPDRAHVEFAMGVDAAAEAGRREGLRTRPKAVQPPRTVVFVESGAEVKRATDVVGSVVVSLIEDERAEKG
jgi:hypothetical protein